MQRILSSRGHDRGLATLEQRFAFAGPAASADAIERVLLTAPLTGPGSIFGERPGTERVGDLPVRSVRDFVPAPAFRFDVELERLDTHVILVRFSQPDRRRPYLRGELVWTVADNADGATLDEQINTTGCRERGVEPLGGVRPSLRRWLFFRVGHRRVMDTAMANVAALLDQ